MVKKRRNYVEELARFDSFSEDGARALYEWLVRWYGDDPELVDLEPYSLAKEWKEYEDEGYILFDYDVEDVEEVLKHTPIIRFDGGMIVKRNIDEEKD